MARESNELIATQSSIALLQERFRKLRRVKEMREGRELSKTLNEPKWFNPTRLQHHQPDSDSKLFFHTEMTIQQRPTPHMSLWPDSQMKSKQQDLHSVEAPTVLMLGLLPEGKRANKRKNLWNSFDDAAFDDIDTSLHL